MLCIGASTGVDSRYGAVRPGGHVQQHIRLVQHVEDDEVGGVEHREATNEGQVLGEYERIRMGCGFSSWVLRFHT